MKLKLDENIDVRLAGDLARAGHDVETVRGEELGGKPDQKIFSVCVAERRVLVTHDLDFSNVLRFPPEAAHGVIVLRGKDQVLSTTRRLLRAVATLLQAEPIDGMLWIVEDQRIRIYPERRIRKGRRTAR